MDFLLDVTVTAISLAFLTRYPSPATRAGWERSAWRGS